MAYAFLARAVRAIERFAELCGVAVAWLMVPLIVAVVYEVVARYAFAAPTLWSFDVTYMLYGAMFMLGAAYALRICARATTAALPPAPSPQAARWASSSRRR